MAIVRVLHDRQAPRLGAAILLGALLVGLGWLQYHWLGDVSAAERQRMRANLQTRASDFEQAFDGELTRAFVAFHADPERLETDPAGALSDAYARWQAGAGSGAPVRAVYLLDAAEPETLRRFDPAARTVAAVAWPPELRDWMARLRRLTPPLPSAPSPLLFADAVEPSISALMVAVPHVQRSAGSGKLTVVADPATVARAILIQLDAEALRTQLLAGLVAKYFGAGDASEYNITIVRRDDPSAVILASDPAHPLDARTADVSLGLFDLRMDDLNRVATPPGHAGESGAKVAITIVRRGAGRLFTASGDSLSAWRLFVRYRSRSLDAIVAASRRRNLAMVMAVLLLLAGSVGLILASADRQRRLARQQMEFVAAVSHELRTPLAVICSAGENLADGVVTDAEQVKRYGSLVEAEGRRLGDMVERVLLFAGIGSGVRVQAVTDVDLARVVADAVAGVSADAQDRGVTVAVHQAGALPAVAGDFDALRSAVQNVVANAVKYSRNGGVVDVTTELVAGPIVRIRVSDRGLGIDAADLAHVFEPFYRGQRAVDAQVRGSGIGLSVVRHVVHAHGGDVAVESRAGGGTTVTVVLPVGSAAEAGRGRGQRVVRLKHADARS